MFRSETGDVLLPAIGFLGIKPFSRVQLVCKDKNGPLPSSCVGDDDLIPPSSPQVTQVALRMMDKGMKDASLWFLPA